MCFCGSILWVFYRTFYFEKPVSWATSARVLETIGSKSYNLKGIYSIILKFVEMIATYITNKTVSGNLLILKTFTLTVIPVRLLWVSLWRFTKHCIKRIVSGLPGKNRIIEKLKSDFELKLVKGNHNVLVDGSQETRRFIRIEKYCYLLVANFISFNLIWG